MMQAVAIIECCLDYTASRRCTASEASDREWINSGYATAMKPVEMKQQVANPIFLQLCDALLITHNVSSALACHQSCTPAHLQQSADLWIDAMMRVWTLSRILDWSSVKGFKPDLNPGYLVTHLFHE
jgi:hypothetical protein